MVTRSYNRAMLILTAWLGMMGAGALCYPRRPRLAGVLFLAAAAFMFSVWTFGAIGDALPLPAITSAALGVSNLWRFRDPVHRAAHVAEWTRTE